MELSAKQKHIADLKEIYRRKTKEELNTFQQKYPNAFAPFTNEYINYLFHIYLSLTFINALGATSEALIDGGAAHLFNSSVNIACLVLSLF